MLINELKKMNQEYIPH